MQTETLSAISVLSLGLVFGLKHAIEADHVAAVTAIVSERKSILSSSLVGGLWGIGHTLTLFIAGVVVILLNIQISERTALALEFGVAIMLVVLGANVIRKLMRGGTGHVHQHARGSHTYAHPHTHHGFRLGLRPIRAKLSS